MRFSMPGMQTRTMPAFSKTDRICSRLFSCSPPVQELAELCRGAEILHCHASACSNPTSRMIDFDADRV